jgi:hypothetical protein
MSALWDSVADLRRVEFVVLLVMMITPILCGTVLLSIRSRLKTLQTQSSESQGFSYQETTEKLHTKNARLERELESARKELASLRQVTAPRHITESQESIVIEKLHGVKAAPVIVSAYAFEEESAAYGAQIAAALRKAGWEVTLNKASMNDFKGVSLGTVNLMRRPLAGLRELAAALTAAHVDLHQREIAPESVAGSLEDGSLLVVVGRK